MSTALRIAAIPAVGLEGAFQTVTRKLEGSVEAFTSRESHPEPSSHSAHEKGHP